MEKVTNEFAADMRIERHAFHSASLARFSRTEMPLARNINFA